MTLAAGSASTSEQLSLKPVMRKDALAARGQVHGRIDTRPAINAMIDYVDQVAAIEVVSGYLPIRTEIDPLPVLDALEAAGYRICMPVILGKDQPLKFREWTPETPLADGPFGTQIPAAGEWLEPELVITPLVAFDGWGHRLGYGGGYYDRTLAELRAKRRTYAVGFAYAAQRIDRVAIEPTDQRLDAVVTEQGVLFPS